MSDRPFDATPDQSVAGSDLPPPSLPPPPASVAMTNPPNVAYTMTLPTKSVSTAYILSIFFGLAGIHQFYLGRVGRGFIYAFTFGGLGFAVIYDWFTLRKQVERANEEIRAGLRAG